MKNMICLLSIVLLSAAATAVAEDFDGSEPLSCLPVHGHDCLPTEASCKLLKPATGQDLHLTIDVAERIVKSPYRTTLLPIQYATNNTESLVLQGTTLQLVWSATIHRTTGRLTIAIADREGAYVIFGQCKLAQYQKPLSKT